MCTRHSITTAGTRLRPCAVGWRLTCQPSTSHLSMSTAQGQIGDMGEPCRNTSRLFDEG